MTNQPNKDRTTTPPKMEPKYEFTRSQLTSAFEKWNKEYLDHPENFKSETEIQDAKAQADHLIRYLEELQTGK